MIFAATISLSPEKLLGTKYFTNTLFATILVVAVLLVFAAVIRIFFVPKWQSNLKKVTPLQMFVEWFVGLVSRTAKESVGHNHKFVSGFYTSFMVFIFTGIMVEFVGLRSPLSDLNLTLMLGLLTFILIHFYGFKEKKVRRLLHYANPIFDISDAIVPVSIALRLFGNVFSGYAVVHLLHMLPIWAFAIILPFVLIIFTLFHAIIQSYVYMVLSISFISEATE